MLNSATKRRIVKLYGNGDYYSIYDLAQKFYCDSEEVLRAIGDFRRKKRFYESHKKCANCRWKPCYGAPVCYKEVIDHE